MVHYYDYLVQQLLLLLMQLLLLLHYQHLQEEVQLAWKKMAVPEMKLVQL